jgi:hypothetical protein
MEPVGANRFCRSDVEMFSVSCSVAVVADRFRRCPDICEAQAELGEEFCYGGMRMVQYQSHFAKSGSVRLRPSSPQRFLSPLGFGWNPFLRNFKLLHLSELQMVKKASHHRVLQLDFKSRGKPVDDGPWCGEIRSPTALLAGQKMIARLLRCVSTSLRHPEA